MVCGLTLKLEGPWSEALCWVRTDEELQTRPVRATCEMQPCGEKFSKKTTAVSDSLKDDSSVDVSDNESSSSDYHDSLTVQPEHHQGESVKRVTTSETKRILSSARSSSSSSKGAHFDLPQRVSMVHFRNNIWSNEVSCIL
ncbi:unnamed protein product [Trichobilharzia regenti]|nr:unnamed protein product [Trichobilharzia regenti]